MDKHILKAKAREEIGKKVKLLRKEGLLPANVFGKKIKSQAVTIDAKEFDKVYKEAGETSLITLVFEGSKKEERPVLVSNIQLHAATGDVLHVDFHQVDLKEKVTASVPVEMAGEAPAEKQGVGTAVLYVDEVEVEALPTDLPEKFVVDISNLSEVDQAVYVKDLKIDKNKVEIKGDLEAILVKVEPPQKEEAPAPVVEQVPAEGEAKPEGEETPKEEAVPEENKN